MKIRRVQALIVNKTTKKILIIRKKNQFSKEFEWRLIKGEIEKGENKLQALKREIKEEIRLKKLEVNRIFSRYSYLDPFGVENRVTTFLVYAPMRQKMIPNKKEGIKELKWVDAIKAISMLRFEDEKNVVRKLL